MKRIAIGAAALFMILLVLDQVPGRAVPAPHDFQCLQCHVNHNSLGGQTNDLICLTCHNPSGGAKAQGMPFSPADAADPTGAGGGIQSSHNWTGSDTNPKAGAEPPQSAALALKQHEGKMLCAKCHNLHGPRESATNSAPFLRGLNDTDQMCLDCHRSRNTQTHTTGSHPVLVGYSTAVKANPNGFYPTPRSANEANPSASVKLVKGMVVCSTCHGVHYTDSSSKTFDNHSSALFGDLLPSAGYLLRTDFKGALPDDINICTNCHQGKTAHNAGGQNVYCTDCHGGHVAETDGSTPNVWLIRRFMSHSSASGKFDNRLLNRPTYFLSTVNRNYSNADGTGVCQSCHMPPADMVECSDPTSDCKACHTHSNPQGSFAPLTGGCTSCHGQPPVQNVEGGPNGYAKGYTGGNEELSGHGTHAVTYGYTCTNCHKGNSHASGNFQQVFLSPSGTLAASFGATPTYSRTSQSCSTNYCHSNGAPSNGSIKFAPPIGYENAKNTLVGQPYECVSCHGGAIGSFNNLSTNAHFRHVDLAGRAYGCAVCHNATALDNGTISDRTMHVNGAKDLQFSGAAAGTSFNGGTCSTSYCHSNGKGAYASATWTDRTTGACGSCHAALSTTTGGVISSNAHGAHFNAVYGPNFDAATASSCSLCHNYTNELSGSHVNGVIDLNLGYSSNGSCGSCHQQTTNWAGGRIACESCHTGNVSVVNGLTAPDKSLAATFGHGKSGINQGCLACHDNGSAHITVPGGTKRLIPALTGTLNTECKYCHDNGSKVGAGFANMSTHFTVKGGSQAMSCAACHDPHGTSNLSMIKSSINNQTISYTDRINGFIDTTTNQGLCQVCHTQTAHYRAGIPESSHPSNGCLNCHSHNAEGGAFKPKGGCDSCHGYPPAPKYTKSGVIFGRQGQWSSARFEDYSGGGGAHLVAAHISPNARPSEGWKNCAICHNSGNSSTAPYHTMQTPVSSHISNITIAVDPQYRFGSGFTVYTGAKLFNPPAVNATGSCFNLSCHMQPSPRWSIER